MIHIHLLAILALGLQAGPETAAEKPADAAATAASDSESAAAKEAKVEDDNKVICRREAVVGSRFKKKVCATKAQWEEMYARNRETAQDMQRRGKGVDPVN